jgi:hypothetical protein
MTTGSTRPLFERLTAIANALGKFIREHEEEIRAWGLWGTVNTACTEARLYAPMHREAWLEIATAGRVEDGETPDYEAAITSAYGPHGVGFEALRQELLDAPLLRTRQREVEEVIESLVDRRNYVTVCGALPLVEYVLSSAAGKWNDPTKHHEVLKRRLHEEDAEDLDNLLLEYAAVHMVLEEIPVVWKSGRLQVGAIVEELNRHRALHGTGVGWDDATNATRAVLLLAAAARVANALLKPPAATPAGAP